MIDIKDEILSGDPSYRIRDKQGNIVQDEVSIEQITPVIQEGTPINKATYKEVYEKDIDPIGEIKTYPNIEDRKGKLLCDGSAILKEDYPAVQDKLKNIWVWEQFNTADYNIVENDSPDNNQIGYVYKIVDTTVQLYSTTNFVDFTKIADFVYDAPSSSNSNGLYQILKIEKTGDVFVIWRNHYDGRSNYSSYVDLYYNGQLHKSITTYYVLRLFCAHCDHNVLILQHGADGSYPIVDRFVLPDLTKTTKSYSSFLDWDDVTYSPTSNTWWATGGGTDMGIYKSTDDGVTWTQVAYADYNVGSASSICYNRYFDKIYVYIVNRGLYEYDGNATITDVEGTGGTKLASGTATYMKNKVRMTSTNAIYDGNSIHSFFTSVEMSGIVNIGEKVFGLSSDHKTLYTSTSTSNALQLPTLNDSDNQVYGYIKVERS